jgi:hypothetical protein
LRAVDRRVVVGVALVALLLDGLLALGDVLDPGAALRTGGTAASTAWALAKLGATAIGFCVVAARTRRPLLALLAGVPVAVAFVSVPGGHREAGGLLADTAWAQRLGAATPASPEAWGTFFVLLALTIAALLVAAAVALFEPPEVRHLPRAVAVLLLALFVFAGVFDLLAALLDARLFGSIEEVGERAILSLLLAYVLGSATGPRRVP